MIQLNPKLRPSAITLSKIYKNKIPKIQDQRQRMISFDFNLSDVTVPGLGPVV
jgi:hypothetical protein